MTTKTFGRRSAPTAADAAAPDSTESADRRVSAVMIPNLPLTNPPQAHPVNADKGLGGGESLGYNTVRFRRGS